MFILHQVLDPHPGKRTNQKLPYIYIYISIAPQSGEPATALLRSCILKMIPKPFKNGSKLRQKAFKIQAWRHQNRGPEGSGAGLEASLAVLGHPGRFWRHLGSSWRGLGSLLGRLGPRKVANMGPSCSPRRSQNR